MPSHKLAGLPKRTSKALVSGALFVSSLVGAVGLLQAQPVAPQATQLALCAACHGAQGNSQIPSIPSLAGQPKIFIENQLVLIREGIRDVPQMKGMLDKVTDEEFSALAVYFAAQKPLKASTSPVNQTTYLRGQATSKKMLCGTCHLPDYRGQNQIPRLAGQHEEFLISSIKQFRDGTGLGRDTNMAASVLGMKDADIADLAHYLTHFK